MGNASTCGQQPPESGICRTVRTRRQGRKSRRGRGSLAARLTRRAAGSSQGLSPKQRTGSAGLSEAAAFGCSSDPSPNLLRVRFLVISASRKQLLPEAMHPKQASRSSTEAKGSRQRLEALLPTATIVKTHNRPSKPRQTRKFTFSRGMRGSLGQFLGREEGGRSQTQTESVLSRPQTPLKAA